MCCFQLHSKGRRKRDRESLRLFDVQLAFDSILAGMQ